MNKKFSIFSILMLILSSCSLILFLVFFKTSSQKTTEFAYFSTIDTKNIDEEEEELSENTTSVNPSIRYDGVNITSKKDALSLITKHSLEQKANCPNTNIELIENILMEQTDIYAINFCEIDEDYADELRNMILNVYEMFPSIKGKLTNLTLINKDTSSYIASFSASSLFATSNNSDGFPNVYKTLIRMNTAYFLDHEYLSKTVNQLSNSGYFVKNADRTSVLAHEFGHYISMIALINYYNLDEIMFVTNEDYNNYYEVITIWKNGEFSLKIIEEAYNNYLSKNKKPKFNNINQFRESISKYAMARDNSGSYIYDETIAEAFHDYYVNKDTAKEASREIIKVLQKYTS